MKVIIILVFTFLIHYCIHGEERKFLIPQPDTVLTFPQDHGAHPDYQIEWWYLTGNLVSETGERFGFQATFFRFGSENPSAVGTTQVHVTHMSLSHADKKKFYHQEKMNRDGWNAFAEVGKLNLRNANWSLRMLDDMREEMLLKATINSDVIMSLRFIPEKPRVIFGPRGITHKGSDPDAVSYYISFTRLRTTGKLEIEGQKYTIQGLSWMDHEIASNQLSEGLIGWDWTAIQLNDGREIKAYRLRNREGEMDPYSRLIWIDEDGKTTSFTPGTFEWIEHDYWSSPDTAAVYPNVVKLSVPGIDGPIRIQPIFDHQEIKGRTVGFAYWEGACNVYDANGTEIGKAYLELVGYDKELGN